MSSLVLLALVPLLSFASAASVCTTDLDCGSESWNKCCQFRNGGNSGCIDTRYEKCCPNVGCYKYQHCCNATCCSGRESCKSITTVEGKINTCSAIEHWNGFSYYTSFGIPIVLGIGALVAYIFAFALVRAHRIRLTAPVAAVFASSAFCLIWGILLLISRHALPATLICAVSAISLAAVGAIAPAHAPTQVLTIALATVTATFLMMINPFASNSLFSFDPHYTDNSDFGGVLGHAVTSLSQGNFNANDDGSNGPMTCTGWYNGFWRRDPNLYVDSRIHDSSISNESYGLCGRHYLLYIAVIATFETAALPILFLSLLARLWEVRGASRADRVAPEEHHTHSAEHVVAHATITKTDGE